MTDSTKIAAIGPRRTMLAFKSIGASVSEVEDENRQEASKLLEEWAEDDDGPGLILISESLAEGVGAELISDIRQRTGKVIMAIPSHEGTSGLTTRWLKEAMEHSIGVDLISD